MSSGKPIPSTLGNMVLVLLVISLVMGGGLALVYLLTKDAIAAVELDKKTRAIANVLPGFDNDVLATAKTGQAEPQLLVYTATRGGQAAGWAVETFSSAGYSGRVSLMVGFLPDGSIGQLQVLSHAETPGLGAKMTQPGFQKQFIGKNPQTFQLKVKKDGGDVDAIAAATISSRAVCEALRKAWQEVSPLVQSGQTVQ